MHENIFATQLFRTTTVEELRHIATVWYKTVRPSILNLSFAICSSFVELHVVYSLPQNIVIAD